MPTKLLRLKYITKRNGDLKLVIDPRTTRQPNSRQSANNPMTTDNYRLFLMLAYGKAKESKLEYYAQALATEILKLEMP